MGLLLSAGERRQVLQLAFLFPISSFHRHISLFILPHRSFPTLLQMPFEGSSYAVPSRFLRFPHPHRPQYHPPPQYLESPHRYHLRYQTALRCRHRRQSSHPPLRYTANYQPWPSKFHSRLRNPLSPS